MSDPIYLKDLPLGIKAGFILIVLGFIIAFAGLAWFWVSLHKYKPCCVSVTSDTDNSARGSVTWHLPESPTTEKGK